LAHLIGLVVTTTSIIFSLIEIQNGNILVPADPGYPGKWQLNECRSPVHVIFVAYIWHLFDI